MTETFQSATEIAEAIVERVGANVVMGLPIGIGKATHIADALFRIAVDNPKFSLTLFTGLSLEPPAPRSDLERRFLGPFVERWYGNWPVPRYIEAVRSNSLPDNVRIQEFYLRPGAFLSNSYVQQQYANINYSQVANELMRLGVNVVAQLVATSESRPEKVSLGANPEVTLDLLPYFRERRAAGLPALLVGQVNRQMPYMLGDAEREAEDVDLLLDDPAFDYPLFAIPNRRVGDGDYATAMHVASLVRDGGTLQLGIGSLSDAVAHCLLLRHRSPELFADILQRLPGGSQTERRKQLPIETSRFEKGLYSSTELLSDALFSLFQAELLKRPADSNTNAVMHAGFFVGSNGLYRGLRELSEERRALIDMTRISRVNTLFGDEHEKRTQRVDARFVNETMMVTLLGAAVSDALDDGRVVSGVGGQFDFVSMAQNLDNAMSILMCRARREHRGRVSSNVKWNYAHTTVPRHHRDVYVTEYGIAATRGCGDRDIVDRMLHIADARFHRSLIASASKSGKLERGYRMAADASDNRPERLTSTFDAFREHFPRYPLGTEMTPEEQALVEALGWLQARSMTRTDKLRTIWQAATDSADPENEAALNRMQLAEPTGVNERIARKLLNHALKRTRQ